MKDNYTKDKCVICGTSMEKGSTMVFSKEKAVTCHAHQNYKDSKNPIYIKCKNDCAYVEPYGFVPESGCEIHDVKNMNIFTETDRIVDKFLEESESFIQKLKSWNTHRVSEHRSGGKD